MVEDKELEDIKKLPPKERLKRLKELEEKRKKEQEEAKKIIQDSLKEIKLDEMLKEIEVPEQEQVKIDKLFEQARDIEEQVKEDKIKIEGAGTDYARRIQELLPQNTLQEIQQWYVQDNVPPTRGEFLEVYENARQAYDTLQKSMQKAPDQELYSSPSEELTENVVSSMRILRSMGYKMNWFSPGG
jgi:NAD-dependent DNA ligase